jgi:hypothetical protein
MNIGDMFDAAFRLYREHFLTFIGIVALLQVPMAMVQFMVQLTIGNSALTALTRFSMRPPVVSPGQNIFDVMPLGDLLAFYAITIGLSVIQYLVVQNLITGALANAISRSYLGQPISILGAYSFGARRYASLILASLAPFCIGAVLAVLIIGCSVGLGVAIASGAGGDGRSIAASILVGLMLIGLLFLLSLGALFFYVRFLLATQAIVLEGQGPLAGLGRSWRLVGGSFWRTVGVMLLMFILTYLLSTLPTTMVSFALTFSSGGALDSLTRNQVITTLVAYIGLIVALPLQLAVYTLLYYDLRVRKEGYDLELQVQQATAV